MSAVLVLVQGQRSPYAGNSQSNQFPAIVLASPNSVPNPVTNPTLSPITQLTIAPLNSAVSLLPANIASSNTRLNALPVPSKANSPTSQEPIIGDRIMLPNQREDRFQPNYRQNIRHRFHPRGLSYSEYSEDEYDSYDY